MEAFGRALAALAAPGGVDPSARAEAERIVAVAVEDPSVVPALLEACRRPDPPSRLLAAVLLSTAAGKHWRSLSDRDVEAVQSGVLAALGAAESSAELRALAHAADVVAQASAAAGTPWEALLPALRDAARSPSPTHREAAFVLFGDLLESTGAHLAPHHREIAAACLAEASREDSSDVDASAPLGSAPLARAPRLAALAALARLARALGEVGDFPVVAELAPAILRCALDNCEAAFTAGDDERMRRALATLADVVALPSDEAVFGPDPAAALLPTSARSFAPRRTARPPRLGAPAGRPRDDRGGARGLLDARGRTSRLFSPPPPAARVSVAELLLPPLRDAARSDERGDEDASDTVDDAEASGPGAHARARRSVGAAAPPRGDAPRRAGSRRRAAAPRSLGGGVAGAPPPSPSSSRRACELESDAGALEAALRAIARSFQSGDPATARRGALALAELAEHAGAAPPRRRRQRRASWNSPRTRRTSPRRRRRRARRRGGREGPRGFCAAARLAVSKIAENPAGMSSPRAPAPDEGARARAAGRAPRRARGVSTSSPPSSRGGVGVRAVRGGDAERARADGVRGFLRNASEGAAAECGFAPSPRWRPRRRRRVRVRARGTTEALLDAACAGLAGGEAGRRRRDDSRDDRRVDRARVFAAMLRAARVDARVEARAPDRARGPRRARRGSRGGGRAGKPRGGRRGRAAVTTGTPPSPSPRRRRSARCVTVRRCGATARGGGARRPRRGGDEPVASFAARPPRARRRVRRAPVGRTGGGGGVGGGGAGARLARILDAAPRAAEAATRLADVLAREETPEVALAAAVSLETAAERCRRAANALGPPAEGEDARGRRREENRARGAEPRRARFWPCWTAPSRVRRSSGRGAAGGTGAATARSTGWCSWIWKRWRGARWRASGDFLARILIKTFHFSARSTSHRRRRRYDTRTLLSPNASIRAYVLDYYKVRC